MTADLTLYAGWVPAGSNGQKPEEKPSKGLPQTGDDTSYVAPVALGVAGAAIVGGALVLRRRRQ